MVLLVILSPPSPLYRMVLSGGFIFFGSPLSPSKCLVSKDYMCVAGSERRKEEKITESHS